MIAVNIAVALIGIYVVFIVLPSIVMFFVTFGRKDEKALKKADVKRKYYQKHKAEIDDACAKLEHYKHEQVFVYAADGVKLAGTYYDCGTEHTAILVHGYNAIPQTALCFQATDLFEQGFNVLMINQRGHGASGGRFTGLGLLECDDLFEWMKLAREKQPKARFLLYGSSMGCASVAYAADRYNPDSVMGMVLDCGFSSVYGQLSDDALRRRLPAPLILPYLRLLAGKLLHIEIKENVKTHLAVTKVPALFIHGGSDKTVDANNGYSNFHACASVKTAVFPDECGHCACYVKYRDEIMRRIGQICETER